MLGKSEISLPQGGAHQLVIQEQIVSPENAHISKLTYTD